MDKTLRKASKLLDKFVEAWPGEKYFGIYKFLPLFFCAGALMEFSMIKFRVREANFYKVFNDNRAQEKAEEIYLKRKYGLE